MKICQQKLSMTLVKVLKFLQFGIWIGWAKKNGELLGLAVFDAFDIFLTLDKNLNFSKAFTSLI